MLDLYPHTTLVIISLLGTVLFINYDRQEKLFGDYKHSYRTNPFAQFLSLVIWIAVIYIEFSYVIWWKAIIDLILSFLVVMFFSHIISRFFKGDLLFYISLITMVISTILLLINIF